MGTAESKEDAGAAWAGHVGTRPLLQVHHQPGHVAAVLEEVRQRTPDPAVLGQVDQAEAKIALEGANQLEAVLGQLGQPCHRVLGIGGGLPDVLELREAQAGELLADEGLLSGRVEAPDDALEQLDVAGDAVGVRGDLALDVERDLGQGREHVAGVSGLAPGLEQLDDQILDGLAGLGEGEEREVERRALGERVLGDLGEGAVQLAEVAGVAAGRNGSDEASEGGLLGGLGVVRPLEQREALLGILDELRGLEEHGCLEGGVLGRLDAPGQQLARQVLLPLGEGGVNRQREGHRMVRIELERGEVGLQGARAAGHVVLAGEPKFHPGAGAGDLVGGLVGRLGLELAEHAGEAVDGVLAHGQQRGRGGRAAVAHEQQPLLLASETLDEDPAGLAQQDLLEIGVVAALALGGEFLGQALPPVGGDGRRGGGQQGRVELGTHAPQHGWAVLEAGRGLVGVDLLDEIGQIERAREVGVHGHGDGSAGLGRGSSAHVATSSRSSSSSSTAEAW